MIRACSGLAGFGVDSPEAIAHSGTVRPFRGPPFMFLVVAGLIATAVSILFLAAEPRSESRLAFVAELAATEAGRAELFYDVGEHFNARDAVALPIGESRDFRTCRFALPDLGLRQLRFDPTGTGGRIDVRNPRFETARGRVLLRLSGEDFQPVQGIDRVDVRPDGFSVHVTPGENDPIMRVRLDAVALIRLGGFPPLARHAFRWVKVFAALGVAAWVVHLGWGRLATTVSGLWQRHPVAALAVGSALAVGIQCHPVIFFGKSFVSPDIGTYLLYEGFPTLPGYETEPLENPMGSDTGAVFYYHLHQPKLIRDAIFRDGELPLWNRYTMCGVPALGQGQSMFGEPLSLPAVLAGGESWAWDVRYLLARWLYGFGAGLAVWLLTRHRLSSLVTAATAVFIGYFAFRLNHPAQFALAAAPWILVAWLGIRDASTARQLASRGLLLCLANWSVHVSGTVKEAGVLMLCINATGLLLVAIDRAPGRMRLLRIGWAAFWGVVYGLVTAPLWLSFMGALAGSGGGHEMTGAIQSRPWLAAGFFEGMLFRALWPGEPHAMPTANMIVLCGLGWAVVRIRESLRDRGMLALAVGFLGAAAIAYGLVPASWIVRVPMIANIQHVNNTFSCVMIVLGTVMAGGGIQLLATRATQAGWWREALLFAGGVALLGGLYFGFGSPVALSPFFRHYVPSLMIGLLAVLLALGSAQLRARPALLTVLLAGSAVVLLWRHGTYVSTPFDRYVVNPKVRASFHARSPAVDFIDRHMTEPSRPNGIRYNLFSGFNTMLGWEGIYGADPLRNPYFDELARAGGVLKLFWGYGVGDWGQWNEERAATLRPVLDALNVRYHLASPGTAAERMDGLTSRFTGDFDIYESESAWPRAFYSPDVWTYASVDDLVARIRSTPLGRPFAAIHASEVDGLDLPDSLHMGATTDGTMVQPARDYRLTTNTTTFRVRADGPGVVVLTEGDFPESFRAYVDGRRVAYFRANHAFKGVVIPAAGDYEIRFEFWPKQMTLALVMATVGLVLAFAGLLWVWCRSPEKIHRAVQARGGDSAGPGVTARFPTSSGRP